MPMGELRNEIAEFSLEKLSNDLHFFFYLHVSLWMLLFSNWHIELDQVSWIWRKDYHLLTVGLTTYSSDERFSATHLKHSEVGIPIELIFSSGFNIIEEFC